MKKKDFQYTLKAQGVRGASSATEAYVSGDKMRSRVPSGGVCLGNTEARRSVITRAALWLLSAPPAFREDLQKPLGGEEEW